MRAVEATELVKLVSDQRMIAAKSRIHGPEQSSTKQCRSTLVDLDRMFQRDCRISQDENKNYCDDQILSFMLFRGRVVMQ